MSEMQVGSRGIEAGLDSQGLACFNGFLQSAGKGLFVYDFRRASFDDVELFLDGCHSFASKDSH